jgi:16S rRNA (guanine966-N2)-methyltransferase
MRIVAGQYRGRRLAAPRGMDVRPTSDKVREAAFAVLGDIDGVTVLDLFAGTGAMGLEALSRGASAATFVEIDRQAADVVRRNIDATVSGDRSGIHMRSGDAVKHLHALAADGLHYDLVIFDPPYERTRELVGAAAVALPAVLHTGSRVLLELASRHAGLEEEAAAAWHCDVLTARRYGDTSIAVLAPSAPSESRLSDASVPEDTHRSEEA